ncbi:MAG: putative hydrolase or acyltransferase of alpha/beta superfamily [Actinomycetia bacterium]|nr:putative hydrolase or acyltransferase of alpha/beta superfamily [Actinomycetes bacterium]
MQLTVDDGVTLDVEDVASRAEEGPTLVLVHGFGGAQEDFADHVFALAATQRVVTFDLRGHGRSGHPEALEAYSLDRMAADIIGVADGLGLDTFRLLGHSMGGMAARRAVLAHPERVERLVLMDTSAGPVPALHPDLLEFGAAYVLSEGMAALKVLMDQLSPLGSDAYERVLRERPGQVEYNDRKWASLSPYMYSAFLREIAHQPDQLALMAEVTIPTLVIVGAQDLAFLGASRALAATMPDAELVVVPGAGHSPQFENPEAWFDAVSGFLAEPAPSTTAR